MNEDRLTKFANVQRNNLQGVLVEAIQCARAYEEFKENSTWPDEEGLYVKESPGIGIGLVVMEDSIWYGNFKRVLREIEEDPTL